MKFFLCFLFGIFFHMTILPVFENLTELICGHIETLKGKVNLKLVKMNNELQQNEFYDDGNVIGFQYTPENEDFEEDEE